MNTPITDAAELLLFKPEDMADLARRLETDRAALMEALEECHRSMDAEPKCTYWFAKSNAATALAAARANFP